jgi:hypothetical protein
MIKPYAIRWRYPQIEAPVDSLQNVFYSYET